MPSSALHVCPRYFEDPNEANAIYDYGIILRERDPKAPLRGFGFNLMLGLAPPLKDGSMADNEPDVLQGRSLYVSGYRPQDSPSNGPPRRPEGSCVQTNSHQLVYKARTEEGMSGGPVWLGFRGVETVVGIQYVCISCFSTKSILTFVYFCPICPIYSSYIVSLVFFYHCAVVLSRSFALTLSSKKATTAGQMTAKET